MSGSAWAQTVDQSYEQGKAVVVGAPGLEPSQACINCHGIDGRGDPAAAFPRLAGQSDAYLLRALQDYASGRREHPIMTPIAKALSDGQKSDVASYYATQRDVAWVPPPPSQDIELLQYGAGLAAIGSAPLGIQGCINCHGPSGRGLPPNYPYLAGQPAAYLAARLQAWRSGFVSDDTAHGTIMARIAKRMGDREIEATSQYYSAIAPDPLQLQQAATAAGQRVLQQDQTP
jgi:cytochrome c553